MLELYPDFLSIDADVELGKFNGRVFVIDNTSLIWSMIVQFQEDSEGKTLLKKNNGRQVVAKCTGLYRLHFVNNCTCATVSKTTSL